MWLLSASVSITFIYSIILLKEIKFEIKYIYKFDFQVFLCMAG